MSWFRKKNQRIESVPADERRVKTEGIFVKCPECEAALYKRDLEETHQVCPGCSHHFRLDARTRLSRGLTSVPGVRGLPSFRFAG